MTLPLLYGPYQGLEVKYPNALRNVYCGAETGPGWLALVEPLIALCEERGVEVHQIKEKFGGLRFYTGARPPEVAEAIFKAEDESFKICEDCGAPGRKGGAENGGYIRTLCDSCRTLWNTARRRR